MVTVIIPAYNAETTIQRCLDSVLQQNIPVEILLADDGSTDGTLNISESYIHQIRILTLPHRGVSAARNAGLAVAAGEWILFLDADDTLLPDALTMLQPYMTEDTDAVCGVIYRGNETNQKGGQTVIYPVGHELMDHVLSDPTNFLTIHAWVFRHRQEMPYFDSDLRIGEDSDWVLRYLYTARKTIFVSIPVYRYTVSDNSAIHQWRESKDRDFLKLLAKLSRSAVVKEANWPLFVLTNYLLVLTHVIFHSANPASRKEQFRAAKKLRGNPLIANAFDRADLTKLSCAKRFVLMCLKRGWIAVAFAAVKFRQRQNEKRAKDSAFY